MSEPITFSLNYVISNSRRELALHCFHGLYCLEGYEKTDERQKKQFRYPLRVFLPVRHQTRAERAKGETSEEKHLGESLEPAVLADQVPLRHHCGHPEADQ